MERQTVTTTERGREGGKEGGREGGREGRREGGKSGFLKKASQRLYSL